jgi:hypothetical protein
MTWDQEEQHARALGSLLATASSADDQLWLDEAQKQLMTVVALRSAAKGANFSGARGASASPESAEWSSSPRERKIERDDARAFESRYPFGNRRSLAKRGIVGGLLVAAGALFAVGWSLKGDEDALTFTIKDERAAEPQEVGRVRAPKTESRTLEFSDGSRLKLAEGGSVRVRETDEHGAEVVIENGRLHSSVKHLKKTSWSVFAGPYEIQVIGTKFSTEWDPATQRLVVLLDEGSVRVVGSDIEDHVALKPGQRFEAAPRQAWKVTAQTPMEIAAHSLDLSSSEQTATARDTQTKALEAGAVSSVPPSEARTPSTAGPNWADLLRDGKNAEILSDAKRLGLATCYATCTVPRLRALADAARYGGEVSVARDALTHLRSRSPAESARAGYLLGSLSEARGQAASALNWYNTYLSEAPQGPFAAEARAGKMRAYHALGRHSDAQSAASEYLRLYPRGSSAAIARRILDKR